jgi:hypothetical protein
MKFVGMDYLGEELYELVIKSVYSIFIYAIIAYITEIRTKQSFLGKESSDKAFYRWLKIFETFPEGIALIRSGHVLYGNRALKNTLNFESMNIRDPRNEKLKLALMDTDIIAYNSKTRSEKDKNPATNIWQFI